MNRPVLIPLGPDRWELAQDFRYFGYTVPAGFICDLDSVPRVPFVYARYKGRTVTAAILHDYLYRRQPIPRAAADALFLAGMSCEGVPWRFRIIIHLAVRVGGYFPWRRNARQSTCPM